MNAEIIEYVKAMTDPERLCIIGALSRESLSTAQIAKATGLPFATAFNHLAFLESLKIVKVHAAQKKQDDIYELDSVFIEQIARSQFAGKRPGFTPPPDEEEGIRRVLRKYLNPDGSIRQIPNTRTSDFKIILGYVLNAIEPGKKYSEKEVNGILGRFHEDISGLRRDLVDAGMLARERDGSAYWRPETGDGVANER